MISQTAEYALRTIVWLAGQDGVPQTTKQIAAATRVPSGYLAKILQNLGRAGLVKSQRGIHGGFTLAQNPHAMSPLDVLNSIDPLRRIEQCPLGIVGHDTELCPLHRRLDDAIAHIESVLASTKISELVAKTHMAKSLCVEA